jgi:putative endonuclease
VNVGPRMPEYYVYIMTNKSRTLYTGVTNDLERRVYEHKHKLIKGFTSKYHITKLVWYETFPDIQQAIEGEKRIKGWVRSRKITIIEAQNPNWEDLSQVWYEGSTKAQEQTGQEQ